VDHRDIGGGFAPRLRQRDHPRTGARRLEDRGEIRYDRGRLAIRDAFESVWRERVEDGRHVE